MANYSVLKAAVQSVVKTNGNGEITGANLQATLLAIIDALGAGYQFMGVATPSTTPPSSPDYNMAYIGGAGSYSNFGTSVVVPPTNIAIFTYNGSWTCTQVTVEHGGVFDISAFHASGSTLATYADLSAALGTNGANVPDSIRKGGMSVKFVQSYDNKYIQARLMADEFTTDTTQWAIAEEGVYVENPEFIYVKTDAENKILWAIKADGNIYYGAGCPQQVKDYIEEKIAGFSPDEYEDIVAFLSDYLGSDTTLKTLLDSKLDAEGLDADALAAVQAVKNPEYIQVTTDAEERILEGITSKGVKQINLPIDTPSTTIEHIENPEWLSVTADNEGNILEGIKKNGEIYNSNPTNQDDFIIKTLLDIKEGILFLEGIKNEFRYLVPSFSNETQCQMDFMGTNDLLHFETIKQGVYIPRLGGINDTAKVRDPSICVKNGYFYFVYSANPYEKQNNKGTIGMCRTKDLVHYEELMPLTITENSITFNAAWAPAFCLDPVSNDVYIVVSAVEYEGTERHTCLYKYNFNTHSLEEGIITNINQIDAHLLYDNGNYYMVANGPTLWKSRNIGTEWELITNIGQETGISCEAPFMIHLDNGKWRCFGNGSASSPSSRFEGSNNGKMYYCDSTTEDIEGTWESGHEIIYPRTGLLQPTHFTIFDFIKKTF